MNDVERIIKRCREQGLQVESTTKGWKVRDWAPFPKVVTIHRTPSDHRALKNIENRLAKLGYQK